MNNTLVWKGKTAEQMGLKIISLPPIQISTEKVEEKELDGRDGTLTLVTGYTSTEKPVEADYRGSNPVKIATWLQGSGEVIFGNLPDRYYKARINNVVPISQILQNYLHNFQVKFQCQPFGYLLNGKKLRNIKSSGTILDNPGDKESLPLITCYGTGKGTLIINGISYIITNINNSITLDCAKGYVLEDKGDFFESETFPELITGKNTISWSGGITKIDIIPNWRCLV